MDSQLINIYVTIQASLQWINEEIGIASSQDFIASKMTLHIMTGLPA